MALPNVFTSGDVFTASNANLLRSNQYNKTTSTKTANYVLVAADVGTRVLMNAAGSTTITVNTSLFAAGDTLEISNIGAGVCTITSGTCTVTSSSSLALAQYVSGTLFFTSASAAIFIASAVTATPGALVLVKAQTVGTTVGSVAVTDAFSATYDNYKITYTGGLASTGGGITMILGATVTGYYSSIIFGSSYGASGPTYAGSANTASWTFMGIASTASASVNAEINCPFLTVNTLMSHSRSDAATAGTAGTGQGYLANSTSYTGFTLTPASGTLTGGTVRVYGYANS